MSFIYGTLSEPRLKRLLGDLQKKSEETAFSSESLAGEVNSLSIDSEQHEIKLANHEDRITTNEASISSYGVRINSLEALTTSHSLRLTNAEADILASESRLDGHDTEIDAINRSIVTNEAEFAAALARPERIYIRGTVTIAGQFTNTIPIHIIGEPGSKLVFSNATYFLNMASSITIENLAVEGISRDQGYFINIGGTSRAGSNAWLRINNCSFRLMGNVVTMTGSGSAPLGPRTVVKHCRVSEIGSTSFTQLGQESAFYITWHIGLTLFDDVHFENIHGNCLYFGQSAVKGVHTLGEATIVRNCYLKDFNRNGIEAFTAALVYAINNTITGGLGSFTNTLSDSGIGISLTGGDSIADGNIVYNVSNYGIEVYRSNNKVVNNIIEKLSEDSPQSFGISIDTCTNTLVDNNQLSDIKHATINPKYGIKARVSSGVTITNNKFINVSYACWIDNLCESIDFINNQMLLERDSGAFAVRAFKAFSGNKHMVIHNRVRLGTVIAGLFTPTDKQETFEFAAGIGGYYDYTSGLITAGGTPLSFGNVSPNIVV